MLFSRSHWSVRSLTCTQSNLPENAPSATVVALLWRFISVHKLPSVSERSSCVILQISLFSTSNQNNKFMAGCYFSLVHDINSSSVWNLTRYYHYNQVSWAQNQRSFMLFTTVLILLLPVCFFKQTKTAFRSCYHFSYSCCGSCSRQSPHCYTDIVVTIFIKRFIFVFSRSTLLYLRIQFLWHTTLRHWLIPGVSKAVCALDPVTTSSPADCHENVKTRTACHLCKRSVSDTNYREVSEWLRMVIREVN